MLKAQEEKRKRAAGMSGVGISDSDSEDEGGAKARFGRRFESEERRALSACSDANEDCPGWADIGECKKNPDFMHAQCRLSCKVCELPANATLPKRKRTGCILSPYLTTAW